MTTHELKTPPVYFQRVWDGEKTFEVRLDDRGYQKGDTVTLCEWDRREPCQCQPAEPRDDHAPGCARYSGRSITARIGFVMASTPPRGNQRGFNGNGYVVFSLVDPAPHDARPKFRGTPVTANVVVTPGAAVHAMAMAAAARGSRLGREG